MIGAVIENLSNRKLFGIFLCLLICQLAFFILGAVYAPEPSTSMEFLMTRCKDPNAGKTKDWFFIRPKNCDIIRELKDYHPVSHDMRDIVFVAQMPHARAGVALEYSAWFQFLVGFLDVEIEYNSGLKQNKNALLEFDIRMAYRKHDDPPTQWNEFISTTIQRTLTCEIDKEIEGYRYHCSTIDLFELGSNNYPFYLLNIRLPANETRCRINPNAPNCAIGQINDLRAAHQNGGFTLIWLWLKTIVTPFIFFATWWYYKRIEALNRKKILLEKAILALGCSLIILDLISTVLLELTDNKNVISYLFPLEWFSIWFHVPALLLLSDLRQGLFYTILFSFWLIFAGEHLIDDTTRNNIHNYWRNLSLVGTASIALLFYDLAARGRQLLDPFASIWESPRGTFWAYFAIILAFASIIIYFLFLCFKIWRVWTTIKQKRASQYYLLNEVRRLKVEAIIYRFKFLMILTLVCAALTIFSYTIQEYDEGMLFDVDEDDFSNPSSFFSHSASAFFTGTFGMWNIYVCLLLFMYAPSHKQYAHVLEDENEDLMDPKSTTESTPMTTFLKSATD